MQSTQQFIEDLIKKINKDSVYSIPEKAIREALTAMAKRCENDYESLINLILPMAKAWSVEHPVGSNQKYIEYVESVLNKEEK